MSERLFGERWGSLTENEFHRFEEVVSKRSDRPDIHAFILLDELFPDPGIDMVDSAEHDVIWLSPDGDKLESLTDDQIVELSRCGVFYDEDHCCLSMFV